jgi:hypothetical protein
MSCQWAMVNMHDKVQQERGKALSMNDWNGESDDVMSRK